MKKGTTTAKAAAVSATTSKFLSNLTSSHEGIKEQRAKQLTTSAQLAQEALLNTIRNEVNTLETSLDQLTDLHPTNSTDLRVGGDNFDAARWVRDVQSTKVALVNKKVELTLAEGTYNEWFKA